MIRRALVATAIVATGVVTACSDTTAPDRLVPADVSLHSSRRSGTLHVEKDCTGYQGQARQTCLITSSNVKAIKFHTTIIYARAAVGASLNTRIVLDPPGRGHDKGFGYCSINLAPVPVGTRVGTCTLSGGTGEFSHLHARVAVSYIGGFN